MTPDEINQKLWEDFDPRLFEQKQGMTYIAAEQVRLRVIQATNNHFDWVVDRQEFRPREDGPTQSIDRTSGEITRPGTLVAVCYGHLTIPELGTRAGVGCQEMQVGSGADAGYKGAESDAFKRAAMAFGVGLKQLYLNTNKAQQQLDRAEQRKPKPQTDMPPQAEVVQVPANAPVRAPQAAGAPFDEDAEKQAILKHIFTIAGKLNVEEDTLKDWLRTTYRADLEPDKFSRKRDLSLDQLTEARDKLNLRWQRQERKNR